MTAFPYANMHSLRIHDGEHEWLILEECLVAVSSISFVKRKKQHKNNNKNNINNNAGDHPQPEIFVIRTYLLRQTVSGTVYFGL